MVMFSDHPGRVSPNPHSGKLEGPSLQPATEGGSWAPGWLRTYVGFDMSHDLLWTFDRLVYL